MHYQPSHKHRRRKKNPSEQHCNVLSSQCAPASPSQAAVFTVFHIIILLEAVCVGCTLFSQHSFICMQVLTHAPPPQLLLSQFHAGFHKDPLNVQQPKSLNLCTFVLKDLLKVQMTAVYRFSFYHCPFFLGRCLHIHNLRCVLDKIILMLLPIPERQKLSHTCAHRR